MDNKRAQILSVVALLTRSFPNLIDNALTWYGKFGGMQEGDDDANLLDLNRKPYRDLIIQNTISVFDFRTYLFGRQCNLLFRLRRPVEICHRALTFIPSFAKTVREHVVGVFTSIFPPSTSAFPFMVL
jgi:hypothetical protein